MMQSLQENKANTAKLSRVLLLVTLDILVCNVVAFLALWIRHEFSLQRCIDSGFLDTYVRWAIPNTLAVLALYSAVGCWNEYFNSMIYLRNEDLYPLQLFLRNILTAAESIDTNGISSSAMLQQAAEGTKQVQYALIVVSTVPLVALYFLAQKSFKKGIMVGSIKG
jgi:hypothetical protein